MAHATYNVLVTGANRGIGLELVRQLLQRSPEHVVYAVCRSSSPELDALASARLRVVAGVDAAAAAAAADGDDAGFQRVLDGVDAPLHLVVCNAGILINDQLASFRAADLRAQMHVNAVAPALLCQALVNANKLAHGAKIALITSRLGSMADNTSGAYYGYRASKAALNAIGVSLAVDLRAAGVAVAILHPGFVKTAMTGGRGNDTPAAAAANLLQRIDQLTMANSGTFWHANGEVLPW